MEKVKTSYSKSMVDAIIEISEDMKCEIDDKGDLKRARERFGN